MVVNICGLALLDDFKINYKNLPTPTKNEFDQFSELFILYLTETALYGAILSKIPTKKNAKNKKLRILTKKEKIIQSLEEKLDRMKYENLLYGPFPKEIIKLKELREQTGHDLKITTPTNLYQEKKFRDIRQKIIEKGISSGTHITYIVQETFQEIYHREIIEKVDIYQLMDTSVKRHKFSGREISYEILDNKIEINGSTSEIYKIIYNITGNAISHGHADKIIIKIEEGTSLDQSSYLINFTDNGTGFPPGRNDLHEKYVTTGDGVYHTGLGMYMMDKITKALGGILTYGENTVSIEIPKKQLTHK